MRDWFIHADKENNKGFTYEIASKIILCEI
jgi:hypothetical protein